MKKHLTLCLLIFSLSACSMCYSTNAKKSIFTQDFNPKNQTVILIGTSKYTSNLRTALGEQGFKVLRFAGTDTISVSNDKIQGYVEANASYAIEITKADYRGYCLSNDDSHAVRISVDIIDITNNEVVATFTRTGWTEQCSFCKSLVFDNLSEEINAFWKPQK
ncbi:hypothetical protein AAIR98_001470 [Elusimicrobium simillimum]|uniref:hypothetical protein n=1 Tax=Elusimicrobium simillimum TaxID=3143438 RepID=UPI003C6F9F78